jgi:hypothetical protein
MSKKPARTPPAGVNGHILDLGALLDLRGNPGYYNPDARVALMRRRRSGPHDEWLADFSSPEVVVQWRASDRDLAAGPWGWQATAGGDPLEPAGPWEEVCWHSDSDGDYLEIEQTLSRGWRLERQMFLAREDRFLFLADALLGPSPDAVEIRYRATLPTAAKIVVSPAAETREMRIVADRQPRATLLPLAMPEWRSDYAPASLDWTGDSLSLEHAAHGRNLYAPLFIDLDPGRQRAPLTWRRLTVAESLRTVGRDEAVGYRVQVGVEQWLVYRTLAPRGNRSVLGVNTVVDFLISRFLASGGTEPLIVVE